MRDLSNICDSVVGCFAQANNVKIIVLVVLFKDKQFTSIGVKETEFEFVRFCAISFWLHTDKHRPIKCWKVQGGQKSINCITIVLFTFMF